MVTFLIKVSEDTTSVSGIDEKAQDKLTVLKSKLEIAGAEVEHLKSLNQLIVRSSEAIWDKANKDIEEMDNGDYKITENRLL